MKKAAILALAALLFLTGCRSIAGRIWLEEYKRQGGFGEDR